MFPEYSPETARKIVFIGALAEGGSGEGASLGVLERGARHRSEVLRYE
jgi:hypothetical protein